MSDITQQIKRYCLELIMLQVNRTYDASNDYFTALAENAIHPNDRTLYIDTMHGLGFDRKMVITAFEQAIDPAFNDLIGAPGTEKQIKIGGKDTSSLKGHFDLEEKLALETMISKANTLCALPMSSINRSLNSLMGDDWTERHQNPLVPELLIRAWVESIHKLDIPVKAYLGLYGLFDVQILKKMPILLDKVGRYLEQLPMGKSKKKSPSARTSINQSSTDNNSTINYEDEFADIDAATNLPDYSTGAVFGSESTEQELIDYDEEPEAELHTEQLIRLLDSLQRNRELDDSEFYNMSYQLDFRPLMESFKTINGQKINPWTIGQVNDDVIDMTSLLFSFIMEDPHLPDDIRYYISRLQIPYLKLGLHDKSIFSDKEHPARRLLNSLAESISLWDPAHTGGLDQLLSEIMATIDGILDNFMMEVKIFSQYQKTFDDFLSGDAHVDEEMQQRQRQTASKTAKADNARLYIESTLDRLCENKRIPPVVNNILENYWSKVLFLEYLKGGGESDGYAVFVETTKILVQSVQAKHTAEARKDMAKQLPNLIRRIKAGFTTISVTTFETVDVFRDLQECHMLVLKERPELEPVDEFEVDEIEYAEFQHDQMKTVEWNRVDLENALLEESIERSLNNSDIDPYAFDDNKNIISSKKDMVRDTTAVRAERERGIIDLELKEARDAYEQALKDHQEKKVAESGGETSEADDFMTQFFQDPEFIKKQYEGKRDLSNADDTHVIQQADDFGVEDDTFVVLEDPDSEFSSEFVQIVPKANIELKKNEVTDDNAEVKIELAADLSDRAHGALEEEFNELGEDKVHELIERLKVGLWVDFYHADGTQIRAMIMAIVPTVGKYIFGDRSGHKIIDYNKLSLAEALRTGTIRLTDEDNAYDKTLESVIANLRIMKKAEDD